MHKSLAGVNHVKEVSKLFKPNFVLTSVLCVMAEGNATL